MPAGSLANGDAALALADLLGADDNDVREHLVHFAIRVGARRLTDAATCLHRAGFTDAAATIDRQARLVGSLQQSAVTGDTSTAVDTLRALAPTYDTCAPTSNTASELANRAPCRRGLGRAPLSGACHASG
ncbi:hypothetical protein ACIG56_02550 [Nocardia fusca]|uniref:hypothetical protein n=1 Tax=Nocardia fusca TaxID=941183 RepID=UPI0037C8F108